MTNDNSVHPKTGNAFLDGMLGTPDASAAAKLAAQNKQRKAEVVARWRATLRSTFDHTEDEGDFAAWDDSGTIDRARMYVSEDWRGGFKRYAGEPWARQTEAGWLFEQISAYTLGGFTPVEQQIIRDKFRSNQFAPPASRRWVLFEDRAELAPMNLPSRDREPERWSAIAAAFVDAYRRRLPDAMHELGMVVGLAPGEPLHVALWLGEPRTAHAIGAWLRHVEPRDEDNARFRQLDCTPCRDWHATAPVGHVAPTARKAGFAIHTTGIEPLDALLATKGIPRGARVFVQAATGQGKSVLDLQIAEHFAADGFRVVWVATSDESPESITARRLQRIGYTRDESLRLALGDDAASVAARATLNPNLEIVDGRDVYLEDVIARTPDVIVLDPVQKIRTRAGDDGETAVRVAERSGITLVAAASKVRSAGKRARIEAAFGGAYIENGATLLLDLERDGAVVTATLLKSRYGGEGQSFSMALDADRQVLAPCDNVRSVPAPVSETDANRHDQILAALAKGPKTARALRQWVAGNNVTLAAALGSLVAAGKIVLTGREYALKELA